MSINYYLVYKQKHHSVNSYQLILITVKCFMEVYVIKKKLIIKYNLINFINIIKIISPKHIKYLKFMFITSSILIILWWE